MYRILGNQSREGWRTYAFGLRNHASQFIVRHLRSVESVVTDREFKCPVLERISPAFDISTSSPQEPAQIFLDNKGDVRDSVCKTSKIPSTLRSAQRMITSKKKGEEGAQLNVKKTIKKRRPRRIARTESCLYSPLRSFSVLSSPTVAIKEKCTPYNAKSCFAGGPLRPNGRILN